MANQRSLLRRIIDPSLYVVTPPPVVNPTGDYFQGQELRMRLVDPSFNINALPTATKNLLTGLVNAWQNGTMSPNMKTNPGPYYGLQDAYANRMTVPYFYGMMMCFEETGWRELLNCMCDFLNEYRVKGYTTSNMLWPSVDPPNYAQSDGRADNNYPTGTYLWPQASRRALLWHVNANQPWMVNDPGWGRFLNIANNKPGNLGMLDGLPWFGVDLSHFEEELLHGLFFSVGMYCEVNRSRRVSGDEDWGGEADWMYNYMTTQFYPKWAARTAVYGLDWEEYEKGKYRLKSSSGTTNLSRSASLGYFDRWQLIFHGAFQQTTMLAMSYEWRRLKTGTGAALDRTGYKNLLKRLLDRYEFVTVPDAAATGLPIRINNPSQYKMVFYPHQSAQSVGGSHTMTYQPIQSSFPIMMWYWQFKDSQNRQMTIDHLRGISNAVGMVWQRGKDPIQYSTVTGGVYLKDNPGYTSTNGQGRYINTMTGNIQFQSNYKGGSLSKTTQDFITRVETGGYMAAFDPTPERYNIRALNWRMQNQTQNVNARFNPANVIANAAHADARKTKYCLVYAFICLRNPSIANTIGTLTL